MRTKTDSREGPISIEEEELRGLSRSIAEIEWLLLCVVLLYHVFGGTEAADQASVAFTLVAYALSVMGFRYARFFKHESRWKLAVETWIMTAFITWSVWHTGRLDSPLLNTYLLVIIASALALGKLTTLLELALIGVCFVFLAGEFSLDGVISLRYAAGMFAVFAPFVLVAYTTTMFASDIRYGLSKARLLSETDELTGTLNRRGFAIIADRLFGQAVRYNRPISLLGIDCDNLKQVNDQFGHKAGDTLLKALVDTMHRQLRQADILARQGGDEFVVLLPETPAEGALEVAEKLRLAVASSSIALAGHVIRTTVSIGVASYPEDGTTLDLLQGHSDHSMYEAKLAGRNQVRRHGATTSGTA